MKLVNEPDGYVINPLDPHNINPRLQEWISELIEKRDDMSVREEIAAIAAIGRLQVLFIKLREEGGGGVSTGTAVKQFERFFKDNATRASIAHKRKGAARRSSAAIAELGYDEPDDELE